MNKDRDLQELQSKLTTTCETGHQPVAMDTDDRGNPNGENNRQLWVNYTHLKSSTYLQYAHAYHNGFNVHFLSDNEKAKNDVAETATTIDW